MLYVNDSNDEARRHRERPGYSDSEMNGVQDVELVGS